MDWGESLYGGYRAEMCPVCGFHGRLYSTGFDDTITCVNKKNYTKNSRPTDCLLVYMDALRTVVNVN